MEIDFWSSSFYVNSKMNISYVFCLRGKRKKTTHTQLKESDTASSSALTALCCRFKSWSGMVSQANTTSVCSFGCTFRKFFRRSSYEQKRHLGATACVNNRGKSYPSVNSNQSLTLRLLPFVLLRRKHLS